MNLNDTKSSNNECRIKIGDFCCSLWFEDPNFSASARDHYRGFLSESDPDIIIDVNLVPHDDSIHIPNSILISKTVDGNDFNYHSGLLTGTLNLEDRYCRINVKKALLCGTCVRIFEQFLFQVYYTLLKEKDQKKARSNYMIHGCAVSKDGYGYLFSGPSESGKSTIAKLSSDLNLDILNDELVILDRNGSGYSIESSPFRGDFTENKSGVVPLRAIFLIRHGKKNLIRKISATEFVTRFVREVIYSDTVLSVNSKDTLSEMMDFSADLAKNVEYYELQFLPDTSFWESIDELNMIQEVCE
ncbi:MAG: hypothetical protein SVJ22_10325 [Halobacteriota archaeon]|nr:hypothetical protein [Halobacteriota archaeon]